MTWIDDNKRPLMAVGAILGVAWFGGRYFDKNQSFNALDMDLDRSDCCEVWVEKLYDDGKIGFGQAGNFLLGIEMGDLKCSSLGSPNCSKQDSSAEMFDAERIQYNYVVHREPKGSSKGGWFKSKKAETFEAEKEGLYFVFADGKTMMGLEDDYNAVYLEWKIPYSQIRDYVNEYTDDLWSEEDQEWRLGDGPYDIAYDFAHGKSAPDIFTEPFGEEYSSSNPSIHMDWAKEIEDAVKSRIWEINDHYNLDNKMTKAEIRSFLTGIPSWRKEIAKRAETFEADFNDPENEGRFKENLECGWCGEPYDETMIYDSAKGKTLHRRCAESSNYDAETFEAKGDCAECYGTGGLYDSHMGINDECHSCGGTGFDY